ncbi:WRKY domain-containing protein [Heracleum sosnowskyi]|uniref:WRKY domain-containing protein n=1 Tax=Heracleum sosnowskyi TaxID=360622 RepID=A0AAD8HGR5_9APIA|nr:WRKY domain-containing protein [Heracleum sosnowskyi]
MSTLLVPHIPADQLEENYTCNFTSLLLDSPVIDTHTSTESSMNSNYDDLDNSTPVLQINKCSKRMKRTEGDHKGSRIAFRMKTELEVLDDGYKWRKYGKKMVKSNPNPRNYYKCSTVGCKVKKRVERETKDSSYVITTYEGIHNHENPHSLLYY